VPHDSDEVLSLSLTARQWATIDATLDNSEQNAIDSGDDPARASVIRHAGWDQVPWVGPEKAWPPDDSVVVISLRRTQWDHALAEVRLSASRWERSGGVADPPVLPLLRDAEHALHERLH
jgi:hypothetical protein